MAGVMSDTCSRLTLPAELWEQIMHHLGATDVRNTSLCSKQLLKISQNQHFRASYFLKRHKRCQAIYEASCYPQLFGTKLLQIFLAKGAVMSRAFVQSFSVAFSNRKKSALSRKNWTRHSLFSTYIAILAKGFVLYGESIDITAGEQTDSDLVRRWIEQGPELLVLNDEIANIFNSGRFAPYESDEDDNTANLGCSIIARCPDLLETLIKNGFDLDESDCDTILAQLFKRNDLDEKTFYQLFKDLQVLHPSWQASAQLLKAIFSKSHFYDVPLIILGDSDSDETMLMLHLRDSRDFGPVPTSFKMMKRLYDNDNVFQDLESHLATLTLQVKGNEFPNACVGALSLLYKWFPHMLKELEGDLAVTFYDYWSKLYELKPFDDIGRASITIRQRHMIELLKDIRPQPLHMAQMIFKTGSCKRLSDALKSGLLGSNWITDLNKIIQTFSHWYLENALNGKRLKTLHSEILKCRGFNVDKQICQVDEQFFAEQVHVVLSSWMFSLDLLKPDGQMEHAFKFKSPIGWLTHGNSLVDRTNKDPWNRKRAIDPYSLAFPSPSALRHIDTATFTISQHLDVISLLNEAKTTAAVEGASIASNKEESSAITSTKVQGYHTKRKWLNGHLSRRWNDRLLEFPECDEQDCPVEKYETARFLLSILHPDSPGIRDVLLSHALVNGNVELLEMMMADKHDEEEAQTEKEQEKKGAVLPTMAHLLILQKLQRKPLDVFINSILRGAPFKRGYVQSSTLYTRQKEVNLQQRQEWYAKKGHKDDRAMTTLYNQKRGLQAEGKCLLDETTESTERLNVEVEAIAKEVESPIDSETEDEDDDGMQDGDDLDMEGLMVPLVSTARFQCNNLSYNLSLTELMTRKKSIALWKEHLELLQWFEERDTSDANKVIARNDFFNGLIEILKKVNKLENAIESYSAKVIKQRRKEMQKAIRVSLSTSSRVDDVRLPVKRKTKAKHEEVDAVEAADESKVSRLEEDTKRRRSSRLAR